MTFAFRDNRGLRASITREQREQLQALDAEKRALLRPAKEAARLERKAVRKAQPKREKRVDHQNTKPNRGRVIDKAYKGFIAQLPCIATLAREKREAYGVHVAHVRHSYPHPGWGNPGLQRKPDDWRTLPLLPAEHAAQHAMNEGLFYAQIGIYPPDLCRDLQEAFPDIEAAKAVLRRHARSAP
jgi:hypothetical protein